jgi:FMN reductase
MTRFVAIGGTLRPNSSTERALRAALDESARRGAETRLICNRDLDLPPYESLSLSGPRTAEVLLEAVRGADAIIIGSPGYHGAISGLVKNALDYVEETAQDKRCYFTGMPVGCIATAAGWQAAVATLGQLRAITHALRGWPTPLGIAINTREAEDAVATPSVRGQISTMIDQMWDFLGRK